MYSLYVICYTDIKSNNIIFQSVRCSIHCLCCYLSYVAFKHTYPHIHTHTCTTYRQPNMMVPTYNLPMSYVSPISYVSHMSYMSHCRCPLRHLYTGNAVCILPLEYKPLRIVHHSRDVGLL